MKVTEKFLEKCNTYSDEQQKENESFAELVEKGLNAIRAKIEKKINRSIDDDLEMINSFLYPKNIHLNIYNDELKSLYREKCMEEIEEFEKITNIKIGNLRSYKY